MSLPELIDILRGGQRILLFTGAGISTQSGIPDFRGPKGVWKRRDPVYFQEFLHDPDARLEYWDQKLEGFEAFDAARPNPTHLAITELVEMGRAHAVVTQNVDGLHHAAKTPRDKVIEIHGTHAWLHCLDCRREFEPRPVFEQFAKSRVPPTCDVCPGFLKPATISFGQPLDHHTLERALQAAHEADVVVALGSTLAVTPAADIPRFAAQQGAPYVIINKGATEHDDLATLRIEGDISEFFVPAVEALGET